MYEYFTLINFVKLNVLLHYCKPYTLHSHCKLPGPFDFQIYSYTGKQYPSFSKDPFGYIRPGSDWCRPHSQGHRLSGGGGLKNKHCTMMY